MVSRRKILSRSRDDLNLDSGGGGGGGPDHDDQSDQLINSFRNNNFVDQEDVWFHKDKLYSVSDPPPWTCRRCPRVKNFNDIGESLSILKKNETCKTSFYNYFLRSEKNSALISFHVF